MCPPIPWKKVVPRHVVDPLASLPIKLGWINTFTLRNRKISWNNASCNNGAFGANGVQSGRTSFHTKCFHSGEETTKVLKSVPQVVRRSYSCLYPWSMRACSTTSCLQEQVFVSGCLQKQVFVSGWENGSQSSPTYGSRSCHLAHYPPRNWHRALDHSDTRLCLFVNLTSWSRYFHTPELYDSRRSHGYKTLSCP